MKVKITRRQLVAASVAATVVTPLTAQQPAPSTDLEKSRASHRDTSATLAKFDIPQSTEPAFVFRA